MVKTKQMKEIKYVLFTPNQNPDFGVQEWSTLHWIYSYSKGPMYWLF